MLSPKSKFSESDNELAEFAKALALPVRVAIFRLIVEKGNVISKEELFDIPFTQDAIKKHVAELKALGILKAQGTKYHLTYTINQELIGQMSNKFSLLFASINSFRPNPADGAVTTENPSKTAQKQTDEKPVVFASFGAFIKEHRQELNISQEEFAKKLDIERANLSRIESGKKAFNASKLKELSKALYIDLPTLKKEYYSYKIAQLADESGLNATILDSAKEKINQTNT